MRVMNLLTGMWRKMETQGAACAPSRKAKVDTALAGYSPALPSFPGNLLPASPRSAAGGAQVSSGSRGEFIDCQRELLGGFNFYERRIERLKMWLATAIVTAVGGWVGVGILIWMRSKN